jgi:hypothetical protein
MITLILTPIAFIVGLICYFANSPRNFYYILPFIILFILFAISLVLSPRKSNNPKNESKNTTQRSTPRRTIIYTEQNNPSPRDGINNNDSIYIDSPIHCPNCGSLDITKTYGGKQYCKKCSVVFN